MKLQFGDYTYFGDGGNADKVNNSLAFDAKHFQELVNNNQYEQAADYAAKYHFNDPRKQQELENYCIDLRRNGRILGALYSRVQDPNQLAQIQFADRVFQDGGLEYLENNTYADNFAKLKRSLGSTQVRSGHVITDYTSKDDAVSLEIKFQPKVQRLFGSDHPTTVLGKIAGWFGDILIPDNDNNVDNFYEQSGLDQNALEANGVTVENKDGRTTLRFAKSNPLANRIIYNADKMTVPMRGDMPMPRDSEVEFTGYDAKGNKLNTSYATGQFAKMIDDANETKQKYFKANELEQKEYSSTIGGYLDDQIEGLNVALTSGQISPSEYARLYKNTAGAQLLGRIKSAGSADLDMYITEAALNDKLPHSERLIQADNEQRQRIWDSYLSGAKPTEIHFNAMVTNGKIGTLVTIDAPTPTDKELEEGKVDPAKKEYSEHHKRVQIFIPGFAQELVQQKINRDTNVRASQEINSMQDYGYEYRTRDGRTLRFANVPDSQGNPVPSFVVTGKDKKQQTVSVEQARKLLNKDMMITDANAQLKYQFLNNSDQLINYDGFELAARRFAITAANELDPGVPLVNSKGKPYTVDDIFSFKAEDDRRIDEAKGETINYQMYDKISDIMDIYNQLMEGVNYYTQK